MKPRILLTLHSLGIGGAERLTMQMLPGLLERYEVSILCLDELGEFSAEARELGAKLFCVSRAPGLSLRTILDVRNVVAEVDASLIHAHQYTPWFYSVLGNVLNGSKARVIFTEHGRHFPDRVSLKRRLANKFLLRETDEITAVSDATRVLLARNDGVPIEKISVIRNGLSFQECDAHPLKNELGIPEESFLIGYVGSLKPVKNPLLLLEAFSLLIGGGDERAMLAILGEGVLREEMENQVAKRGLAGRVFFLGAKHPVAPYLRSLDALVLSSFSEGVSLALLEAMGAGVPVIASDVGGNPEVVTDGVTGALFPSGDSRALAAALLQVQRPNPQQIERAKSVAFEKFSFSRMMSEYLSLYQKHETN